MKKYSFSQFTQLLEILNDPTNYKTVLHQIGDVLDRFDPEYDGESASNKYPVALAKWVEEKGIDSFTIILTGSEMSTHHLGGDDFVEMMDDVLSAAVGGKYKFFYTYYGDDSHAVTIGTSFQLGDDFKKIVNMDGKENDDGEVYSKVTEYYVGSHTASYNYKDGVEKKDVCDTNLMVGITYEQDGKITDEDIHAIMGISDDAGTFIGSDVSSRDMQWYYEELPITKIEDLRKLFKTSGVEGRITIDKTERG